VVVVEPQINQPVDQVQRVVRAVVVLETMIQ
jgi:hypothetical protein